MLRFHSLLAPVAAAVLGVSFAPQPGRAPEPSAPAVPLGGFDNLTLTELRNASTGVVSGVVVRRSVRAIDPGDGAPLYLTTVTIRGTRVYGGTQVASAPPHGTDAPADFDVQFPGGFVDGKRGSFNSTAPPRHATRQGRPVVVFYESVPNALGSGPGDVAVGGSSGWFTAFDTRSGERIVQGRATSVALPHNVRLDDLVTQLSGE